MPLDVDLGKGTTAGGEEEMFYRLLKAEHRSFERLVLSDNMVTDHACGKYDAALHSAAGLMLEKTEKSKRSKKSEKSEKKSKWTA